MTIVLLVSRSFLLEQIFERLSELFCDRTRTNLLVVVDGDTSLFLKCRNNAPKLNETLVIKAPHVERRSLSQVFRRKRIGQLHEYAKQFIQNCDYVLLLEDDGLPPRDSLKRLLPLMKEGVGFVSGLQVGRWNSRYIGGWIFDDPNDPKELSSIEPGGIKEVHAAGFYCCLMRLALYETITIEPTGNWGPDIETGRIISTIKYKNYMDTDLVVDHYAENGRIFNLKDDVRIIKLRKDRGIWRTMHVVMK